MALFCFRGEAEWNLKEANYLNWLKHTQNVLAEEVEKSDRLQENFHVERSRWRIKEENYVDRLNSLEDSLNQQEVITQQYKIYEENLQKERQQLQVLQNEFQELKLKNEVLGNEIGELREDNSELKIKIKGLEERLDQNEEMANRVNLKKKNGVIRIEEASLEYFEKYLKVRNKKSLPEVHL